MSHEASHSVTHYSGIGAAKKLAKIVAKVVRETIHQVQAEPQFALQRMTPICPETGKQLKECLRVDNFAENTFSNSAHHAFPGIVVHGEERLNDDDLDLSQERNTLCLVDAVDGTDLLERNLSNWCCAAILYTPSNQPGKRIGACAVGLWDGSVYIAADDNSQVFVKYNRLGHSGNVRSDEWSPIREMQEPRKLEDASICFYGQKVENLHAFTKAKLLTVKNHKRLRIYNMAGIPMMMRMIDPIDGARTGINAVFDLSGQKAHDFVPGAYIAFKANATIFNEHRKKLNLADLDELLLTPGVSTQKYVMSTSEALANNLHKLLFRARKPRNLT